MKSMVKVQLGLTAVVAAAGVAFAAGPIDLWTTDDGYVYVDQGYINEEGNLTFSNKAISGSTTELRLTLAAGTGSLTEEARFVGTVENGAATPLAVDIVEANEDWTPVQGAPEATLSIETGDKDVISGELFGYEVNAESLQLQD